MNVLNVEELLNLPWDQGKASDGEVRSLIASRVRLLFKSKPFPQASTVLENQVKQWTHATMGDTSIAVRTLGVFCLCSVAEHLTLNDYPVGFIDNFLKSAEEFSADDNVLVRAGALEMVFYLTKNIRNVMKSGHALTVVDLVFKCVSQHDPLLTALSQKVFSILQERVRGEPSLVDADGLMAVLARVDTEGGTSSQSLSLEWCELLCSLSLSVSLDSLLGLTTVILHYPREDTQWWDSLRFCRQASLQRTADGAPIQIVRYILDVVATMDHLEVCRFCLEWAADALSLCDSSSIGATLDSLQSSVLALDRLWGDEACVSAALGIQDMLMQKMAAQPYTLNADTLCCGLEQRGRSYAGCKMALRWLTFFAPQYTLDGFEAFLFQLALADDMEVVCAAVDLLCVLSSGTLRQTFTSLLLHFRGENREAFLSRLPFFLVRWQLIVLSHSAGKGATQLMTDVSGAILALGATPLARRVVWTLGVTLFTSPEFDSGRARLLQLGTDFSIVFSAWCCSATSAVGLCLYTKRFALAYTLVSFVSSQEVSIQTLVELDVLLATLCVSGIHIDSLHASLQ
ncbi:Vacuolar protein 14 C-terminal Fig4p binding, putative [Angomonas deanei]|uniref:Vacuolar protein 14 C-terminal Fig4p binding, putative n=1 Tax=Angomonas deanei TaxID=59799 RepID=A0A7G2CJ02_9TRYP|nr:Vacuolar protein 14 C-terminal Fig4p binding, putative [Angomonas deanei]